MNTKTKKSPTNLTVVTTAWPRETAWPSFPLTERQQLQYLLEVTAKDAQKDSDSGPDESTTNFTKVKRKDVGKENSIAARVFRRNERGETALHVAAIKGDLTELVALIDAGANVNAKDNAGMVYMYLPYIRCWLVVIVRVQYYSGLWVLELGFSAPPLITFLVGRHRAANNS